MNRIDARFQKLQADGETAFIPFFTAGDPNADATVRLLKEAEGAGADVIELGFPFSDPVADGPTIQASYTRVLERGQHVSEIFDMVRAAREETELPVVAMASFSLVHRMGMETFIGRAMECGIDGATIPDLPIEEALGFFPMTEEKGFRLVCFVTPATTAERRGRILEHARGFIYYISVRGITGQRTELPPDLVDNLRDLKTRTDVPVAVGFGVSTPEQARGIAQVADGVIVGSAIVKGMHAANESGEDAVDAALDVIRRISSAVKARS